MLFKQHLIGGFVIGIVLIVLSHIFFYFFVFNLSTIITLFLIIFIYCLLPDIDHPISNITWIFFGTSIIILILGILLNNNFYLYFGVIFQLLIFICAKCFKHRGFIHSWAAGIIFSLPLYYFGWEFVLVGFICYLVHLLLDKIPMKFV